MRTILIICLLIGTQLHAQGDYLLASLQQASSSYDTDASAFMIATGIPDDGTVYYIGTPQEITGNELWIEIDNLVKGYKAAGTWDDFYAIYPFIGGTAFTHKFNLKDPRDSDEAFRLNFVGDWIHSSMGAKGSGTLGTSYADTFFVDSEHLTIVSNTIDLSIGYYNTDPDAPLTSGQMEVGNGDWSYPSAVMLETNYDGETVWGGMYNSDGVVFYEGIISTVHYAEFSALGGTTSYYYNGELKGDSQAQANVAFTNNSLYFNAIRDEASGGALSHRNSEKRMGFAYIGKGFTTQQISENYLLFQNFQTALNR